MIQTMCAFLDFCYIARHNIHDTHSLATLTGVLEQFHNYCKIFCTTDICAEGFNLPRQHSLTHYVQLIHAYGAPNGLCSSITESKHIKAVKEPWQHSNHFQALSQMLLTNQHLNKLSTAQADFSDCGMLEGTCLSQAFCMYFSFLSDSL